MARSGGRRMPAGRRIVIAAGIVVALSALLLGGRQVARLVPGFAAWVDGLGAWGPVAYITGYALATVALVPGVVLTLVAGAVFGLVRGTAYAFAGAVAGETLAFLVARHGARGWVERRIGRDPRVARVDRAVARQGLRIVILLRLSPLVPFNLLNYALGLTRISLGAVLLSSFAMLPGTLLYVYYGKVAGDVAAAASGAGVRHDTAYWVTLGAGLAATAAVTVLITSVARRALREDTEGVDDDGPA